MWGHIVYETLQLAGILAFAISGALIGVHKRLDLLGVIVVGSATGVGGGIIRDIMIGVHPPVSLVYWPNIATAAAGSLLVFFFHPRISRLRHFEVVFDAFGLGLFCANTAAAAIGNGFSLLTAVIVGTVTAIGGGVVRDVMVNEVPGVLTRELYAVSAISGALLAGGLMMLSNSLLLASTAGCVWAIALRLTSYARGWQLPVPKFGSTSLK
ncbi:MAG: trimeric intracellular cation channel family protein [Microbacteriaceae bacterium]|nr:trimeric intracellular cation channel family protein [Microbacteriaceae bacterium]